METEIKMAPVLPHRAHAVFADPEIAPYLAAPQQILMFSEYFDTRGRALRARGFSLRVRRENELTLCTLKGPSAQPDTRLEIQVPAQNLDSGKLALARHPDLPSDVLHMLRAGDFIKLCTLRFTRTARLYSKNGLQVLMCDDQGQAEHCARIGSISELELELRSGTHAELAALAQYICSRHDLQISHTGKLSQALALAENRAARAVNPFFVGAEMLNFCVRSKYIELALDEDKQLRYTLTALGERELPARFGVSFDKPCAFTDTESDG